MIVTRGTLIRSDHPVVIAAPKLFVSAGADVYEEEQADAVPYSYRERLRSEPIGPPVARVA